MDLNIDATSAQWREVTRYIEARIKELTEQCVATAATHETRMIAAHRIEELRDLLDAPRLTRVATEHRITHKPVEVY